MVAPRTRPIPAEALVALLPAAAANLRAAKAKGPDRSYWFDPAGWISRYIEFPNGEAPTAYQVECLNALGSNRRATARGPHGLGKTAMSAWVLLWFVSTRHAAGADWKVITTAGSWSQLRNFFWPEVHKWVRYTKGNSWREGTELLQMSIKLQTGQAFGVASNRAELIEGAHADELLYIYDEAKSIFPETFDASEGAFSGAGPGTGRNAFAWAVSTPGGPTGRFADIHHRKPGFDDWWVKHVTLAEAMASGRISETWVEQRKKQWGEKSPIYMNRVLGEFAVEDSESVIPLAWVEEAIDRWREMAGRYDRFTNVGVDVARFGADRTALALRYGNAISEIRYYTRDETTATTGHVRGILDANRGGHAVVDVVGIGAGVVDQLREAGYAVSAFSAGSGSVFCDRSGELGFANRRSAAWWNLREMLDPSFGANVALPPDDDLIGDLTAPTYRVTSNGRIAVESKDEIRKRLGRSTDAADCVVQAFSVDEPGEPELAYLMLDEPDDIAGGF